MITSLHAAKMTVPRLSLHDDIEIPQLGFGVFRVPPEETRGAVELALEAGYRHIDTAAAYRNEKEVGAALAASGLPRQDYFVTAKLWNSQLDEESTLIAFEASLDRLGLDHVDLYLIHLPVPTEGQFVDTWRAFEQTLREEAARTIGVSNFRIEDLELLGQETETWPTINQVELHPYCQEVELRTWHTERGITTAALSPLAQGDPLGDETTITRLAESHGKTPTQVILRWHLQLGHVVIPRSVTPERIRENIDLFDFELSDEELAAIGGLDSSSPVGSGRATFVAP
jgi:2,5-diketo-D-gluconate reductase A